MRWLLVYPLFGIVVATEECETWVRLMSEAIGRLDLYESRVVAWAAPVACRKAVASNYSGAEVDYEAIATLRRGIPRRQCSSFEASDWASACAGRADGDCCALDRADNALRLPAVSELAVRYGDAVVLQDGWLRPFDVPTCLWPGSYLLARFIEAEPALFAGKAWSNSGRASASALWPFVKSPTSSRPTNLSSPLP